MVYTLDDIKACIKCCTESVMNAKNELEKIDSFAGDGDLGISMFKGCEAINSCMDAYTAEDIGRMFLSCAMALNKAAPSTMGTLITAGFMRIGKLSLGKTEIDDAFAMSVPNEFVAAITAAGKAQKGDRTILDALIPMADAYMCGYQAGTDCKTVLASAAEAAKVGAEETKNMVPRIGRQKWAPDNAAGIIDGGAYLCATVAKAIADKC